MNKKIAILVLVLVLIGFFMFYFFSFVSLDIGNEIITLENGMIIPNETCERLNRVTIIHKTGCTECLKVIPILKKIEEENNLNFIYFDMLNPEDMVKLLELKLTLEKAPIAIIDCKVYGPRTELEYKNYILET